MPPLDTPRTAYRARSIPAGLLALCPLLFCLLAACGGSGADPAPVAPQEDGTPTAGDVPAPVAPPMPVAPPVADHAPPGYQRVFAEEFGAGSLDRRLWCTRFGWGGGAQPQVADPECIWRDPGGLDWLNDEQQRYVDFNRHGRVMHEVSGGVLRLLATRTRVHDAQAPYEAAMVRSKWTFRPDAKSSYYLTSRMKLPNVRGTWPAFWLIPDRRPDGSSQWPPEIDIMEGALNEVEETANMVHIGAKPQNFGGQGIAAGRPPITHAVNEIDREWTNFHASGSLRDRWVEFALEWMADSVCYYIDGRKVLCQRYQWLDNGRKLAQPASIIISFSIGGEWAGRHGIDDAAFPTAFEIDHVRAYRRAR